MATSVTETDWISLQFLFNKSFFHNQNGRQFEIEDKANSDCLLINRNDIIQQKQVPENMSNDLDFCHSGGIYPTNMENNYWIQLLQQD